MPTKVSLAQARDPAITVRVVEYALPRIGDGAACYRLLTTMLDPLTAPAMELAAICHSRWEMEAVFDELKTHLFKSRGVMRSKTPELVRASRVRFCFLPTVGHFGARQEGENPDLILILILITLPTHQHLAQSRQWRLGRTCPDFSATLMFESDEISAASVLMLKPPPSKPPKLNPVLRRVATLGGILARKGDGEPVVKTVCQGLQRVIDFAVAVAVGVRSVRSAPDSLGRG